MSCRKQQQQQQQQQCGGAGECQPAGTDCVKQGREAKTEAQCCGCSNQTAQASFEHTHALQNQPIGYQKLSPAWQQQPGKLATAAGPTLSGFTLFLKRLLNSSVLTLHSTSCAGGGSTAAAATQQHSTTPNRHGQVVVGE
jgi:hypothetical protein